MELKPCPFCGESKELYVGKIKEVDEHWITYIYCDKCGANGPWIVTTEEKWASSKYHVAEETGWNSRGECVCKEIAQENIKWFKKEAELHELAMQQNKDRIQMLEEDLHQTERDLKIARGEGEQIKSDLRKLVEEWRDRIAGSPLDGYEHGKNDAFDLCIYDVEKLIRRMSDG